LSDQEVPLAGGRWTKYGIAFVGQAAASTALI
jgi:hypothetical protein